MAEINEEDLISKKALESPIELANNIDKAVESLMKLINAGKQANVNLTMADSTKKLNKEVTELTQREKELESVDKRLAKAQAQNNAEFIKKQAELKKVQREVRENIKQEEKLDDSYLEQSRTLNKLRGEYKAAAVQYGLNSKEAAKLRSEVVKLDKELKDVDSSVGQNQRFVGEYSRGLKGVQERVSGVIGKFAPFIAGFAAAGAAVNVLRKEIAQTEKNLKTTQNLTGLLGLELEGLTSKVQTTASVFDKEFIEILTPANALMKNLGVSGEEAMNLINEGLVRGLDVNGEFLDSVKEYSVFFDEAGLSARALVEVIATSNEQGIFSDKGVDAIKEASIRLREMTPATKAAIDGIGLSSDAIIRGLEDGSKTVFDVIQDVSREIDKLPPQSRKVGTAIADIFGGAGEDAGLKFLTSLKDINLEQSDLNNSLTQYQKDQLEVIKQTERYNDELVDLTGNFRGFSSQFDLFIATLKASSLEILNDLLDAFTSVDAAVAQFKKTVGQTKDVASLKKELEKVNEELAELQEGPRWEDYLKGAFTGVTGAAQSYSDGVTKVLIKQQVLQERIQQLGREAFLASDNFDTVTKSTKTYNQAIAETNIGMMQLESVWESRGIHGYIDDVNEAVSKQKEFNQTLYDADQLLKEAYKEEEIAYLDQLDLIAQKEAMTADQRISHYKSLQASLVDATQLTEAEKLRLHQDYESQITQIIEDENQKRLDSQLETFDAIAFGLSESSQIAYDAFTINNQAMIEQNELRMDRLQERRENELELFEGNEAKQQEIRARFDAEQAQLEKQQAARKRKQAIADKALAISQAIISTAVAVASVLPNIPLAILTGVLGAAKVAVIASTPIPQFKDGVENFEGGLAVVNDGNGQELIKEGNQMRMIDSKGSALTYLKKGAQVFTAEETEKMLNGTVKGSIGLDQPRDPYKDERIIGALNGLRSDMKKQKQLHVNISKRSVEMSIRNGQNIVKLLNSDFK